MCLISFGVLRPRVETCKLLVTFTFSGQTRYCLHHVALNKLVVGYSMVNISTSYDL